MLQIIDCSRIYCRDSLPEVEYEQVGVNVTIALGLRVAETGSLLFH
jgi:hypothetical protein